MYLTGSQTVVTTSRYPFAQMISNVRFVNMLVRPSRILLDRVPKGHVSDDDLTGLLLQSLPADF